MFRVWITANSASPESSGENTFAEATPKPVNKAGYLVLGGIVLALGVLIGSMEEANAGWVAMIFGGWLGIAAFGYKQNWSAISAYGGAFIAMITIPTIGFSIIGDGSESDVKPSAKVATTVSANADSAGEQMYLIDTALICREAEQVISFLEDLESNRTPDLNNCALNPTNTPIPINVLEERTIKGERVIRWKKSATDFSGWTLASNISDVRQAAEPATNRREPTVVESLENSSNPACSALASTFQQANYITDRMMKTARKYGCL